MNNLLFHTKEPLVKKGWVRSIIGFVVIFTATSVSNLFINWMAQLTGGMNYLGLASIPLLFAIIAIVLLWKIVDRKPLSSLGFSLKEKGKDIGFAILFAFLIMASTFGILIITGQIQVVAFSFKGWTLLYFIIVLTFYAALEEIPLRGYLQRNLMESMHPMWTVVALSMLFGMMHVLNQHINLIGLANCMLIGALVGLYYINTKNLWFPIIFHLFWNYFQGIIFGSAISGKDFGYSLISIEATGYKLLTGGKFGFEGSLVLMLISIISLAYIYIKYRKHPVQNVSA